MFSIWYRDFKYLPRRTASDKVSCDKAFNIVANLKNYGYQRGLDVLVYHIWYVMVKNLSYVKISHGISLYLSIDKVNGHTSTLVPTNESKSILKKTNITGKFI